MKHYLTVGTLWKNEDSYAEDFLDYHKSVGVDHIVIFDREYYNLNKLIGYRHDVDIVHFPEGNGNDHMEAWGKLIKYNQGKTQWLALIDADQCLVPTQIDSVKDILKNYEEFAALQINWRSFGSGGQETRINSPLYTRFVDTCEDQEIYNFHTQTICQPDRVLPIKTKEPHYVLFPEGEFAVNTNKERISENKVIDLNPNTPLSFNVPALHDILYVNHYTNKSKEEWLIKNSKGRADIPGMKMPIEQFEQYESVCNVKKDYRAFQLWEKYISLGSWSSVVDHQIVS